VDEVVQILYWDTSAVLSVLFEDRHTKGARRWIAGKAVHLLSSLTHAEACAVMGRLVRDGVLADTIVDLAYAELAGGPWRRINAQPEWDEIRKLSGSVRLRGADLWHLALATTLRSTDLPELRLLTFDADLQKAALRENLAARRQTRKRSHPQRP
jgi:predicted nucleic acid-binding protein